LVDRVRDGEGVPDILRQLAQGLNEAIAGSSWISRTLGPALRRRLQSDDWIKSPLLVSFLRPMRAPSPLQNPPHVHQGILATLTRTPPGATALYALESVLTAIENESVSGIEHWFHELGNHEGYSLDKRLHSWTFELAAMPRLESQRIVKLPKLPASRSPDYVVRAPRMTMVMEAKLIFGPTWPLKIVHIMLETLDEIVGWQNAGMVFVHPTGKNVTTSTLENEVAALTLDALLQAIEEVVGNSAEVLLSANLTMSLRTTIERELGIRALPVHLPSKPQDIDAVLASLKTPTDTICHAAEDAWQQCAHYEESDDDQLRLDVALVGSENLPAVRDFGQVKFALRQWLLSEVWPQHPSRALCLYLTGRLWPVWLLDPAAVCWPVA
jgi:hypothetical protein